MFKYLIVLLVTIDSVNADGKRLLLTDPDVLAQRLSLLENSHQQLEDTVEIQSTTIQQLQMRLSAKESRLKVFLVIFIG